MSEERTELQTLGEFGLIDRLTKDFYIKHPETKQGIGDDAAILETADEQIVLSTDMLMENTHFDLMYTPLRHLGYKAVVVNISDICAMNAIPKQITVSIAASNRFSVEALEELYAGINTACTNYEIDLIGGDTCSSPKGLVISITAVGYAKPNKIVKRSGAQKGDLLCVSGTLGEAYLGLQLLEREKRVYLEHPSMQPDLSKFDFAVGKQLKPEARLDMVKYFTETNIQPTSMIDLSDGLVSEILHLSKQSEVAFMIHEDKLPMDEKLAEMSMELGLESTLAALHGGEDYELLFTLPQTDFEKVKDHPEISIIGYAREESMGNQLVSNGGKVMDLVAQGWKQFKNEINE